MAMLRNLLRKKTTEDVGAVAQPSADVSRLNAKADDRAERVHRLAGEGRLGEALALADECLQTSPQDGALLLAKSSTLFEWGRYQEAMPWFKRSEAAGVDNFNLYLRAGWTSLWTAGPASAESWMWKAVNREPDEWTGHFGLATALRGQGKLDDAIAAFERALEVSPSNIHCLAQLSDCMLASRKAESAEKYARRAIAASPTTPIAWTNVGVALVAQDRLEEATAAFEHADRLAEAAGGEGDAYLNLGMCLRDMGRLAESLALYERRLPALSAVTVNTAYAHALLMAGKLADGFRQYEFRWLHPPLLALRPSFRKPVWAGQDLRGKTILLRSEQGIGDVIQFIRYAPHVKALGATVLLQVREGVGELASSFAGVDAILQADAPYPPFDYYIHLMSLPRAFGTELASVPAAIPYVHVDPARKSRWTQRIHGDSTLRVGLVWAGDPGHLRDRYRSVALQDLAPVMNVKGARFYSFQVGSRAPGCLSISFSPDVIDLGPELKDFADTAAAIDQMDLLISVDTSVAHLAGALGKRVWTMLATPSEWRWMIDREDTPWYPTMRLFRQRRSGDWKEVIGRIAAELAGLVDSTETRGSPSSRSIAAPPSTLPAVPRCSNELEGRTAPAETAMGIVQYFPSQQIVGDSIGWYGEYLRGQTDLLASLMAPASFVMEAGAGIGAHVLSLAPTVGAGGHFFLYEPRSLFQPVLRQNLMANGIRNVTVMRGSLCPHRTAGPRVCEAVTDPKEPIEATRIETIDELRLEKLDWLKIGEDSEHALSVLAGASETLWRLRPKVFVSATDQDQVITLVARLKDHAYLCWKVTTPYYNPLNFNGRDVDIFSGRTALAVLAIPEEIVATTDLDGCETM